MISLPSNTTAFVAQALGWGCLAFFLFGLVTSIRYSRLSAWMFLLSTGFLGSLLSGLFALLLQWSPMQQRIPSEMTATLATLANIVMNASAMLLVLGLALVFKEIRRRMEFIDETQADAARNEPPVSRNP